VRLYGLLGKIEIAGDRLVRLARAQSSEHVGLTVGQERPGRACGRTLRRGLRSSRLAEDQRRHIDLAVQHEPDGRHKRLPARGLGHIAEGALRQRLARLSRVLRGREHNHRKLRADAAEFGDRAHAVEPRQREVENDDVEIGMLGNERQRPGRVAGLQNCGVRPQLLQKGGKPLADDGVIVDDEQSHDSALSDSRWPKARGRRTVLGLSPRPLRASPKASVRFTRQRSRVTFVRRGEIPREQRRGRMPLPRRRSHLRRRGNVSSK